MFYLLIFGLFQNQAEVSDSLSEDCVESHIIRVIISPEWLYNSYQWLLHTDSWKCKRIACVVQSDLIYSMYVQYVYIKWECKYMINVNYCIKHVEMLIMCTEKKSLITALIELQVDFGIYCVLL